MGCSVLPPPPPPPAGGGGGGGGPGGGGGIWENPKRRGQKGCGRLGGGACVHGKAWAGKGPNPAKGTTKKKDPPGLSGQFRRNTRRPNLIAR